jgi:phosphoribosyl 1,2-cyclic phosphodiesterase
VADEFYARFWGVRGSLACPGVDTLRYGGNTPCVEVRCGDHVLVFDAGTGLRELGDALADHGATELDLFLSHTHLDHVVGLPFCRPLFNPKLRARIWAGHLLPEERVKNVLSTLMMPPLFPVPLDIFQAEVSFNDFHAGETLTPKPGITVRTAKLNHPNRSTGYRVEFGDRAICYITDTEHLVGEPDRNVLDLIAGADIAIYDATYTDAEFPKYIEWGHSTWQEAVRLGRAAKVKRMVIFHHMPGRTDAALDKIGAEAAQQLPGTVVAREGMTLAL